MASEVRYRKSDGTLQRKTKVDDTTGHLKITDGADADVMDYEAHEARHEYGGADAIAANGLHFSQVDKILATSETTVAVAGSGTKVIDKGIYYARGDADVSIQYSTDGGTTWVEVVAAGKAGLIISDGSNVRFKNASTTSENGYTVALS